MKEKIHPRWFNDAKVTCASCGTTWTTGSTRQILNVDICSNCHPFYTGEQRIVDTEGQVDRFMKRLGVRDARALEAATVEPGTLPNIPLSELGIGKQYAELLSTNGLASSNEFIARLNEVGDEGILEIRGVGRKVLIDIKKRLRQRGYELATAQEQ